MPNWAIGLILVVVLAIGAYLAFAKQLPWHSAYEVKAVFGSAQNLRRRLAGANRGRERRQGDQDRAADRVRQRGGHGAGGWRSAGLGR